MDAGPGSVLRFETLSVAPELGRPRHGLPERSGASLGALFREGMARTAGDHAGGKTASER